MYKQTGAEEAVAVLPSSVGTDLSALECSEMRELSLGMFEMDCAASPLEVNNKYRHSVRKLIMHF